MPKALVPKTSVSTNSTREAFLRAGNAIRTRDIDLGKVALYH